MFGDYNKNREIAELLAEQFSLEEILNLNGLDEVDVLEILLDRGLIEDYNSTPVDDDDS
jgi:hypothetical protein